MLITVYPSRKHGPVQFPTAPRSGSNSGVVTGSETIICHLLTLLGAHNILHVIRIRVKYHVIPETVVYLPTDKKFYGFITAIIRMTWAGHVARMGR